MRERLLAIGCDIAPLEGRRAMDGYSADWPGQDLHWEGGSFSLYGEAAGAEVSGDRIIRLSGSIQATLHERKALSGWMELEIGSKDDSLAKDIYLVGTRPLPKDNITCLCRHPLSPDYLLAGTNDRQLLVLDASLAADLAVLATYDLPAPIKSLVCSGKRLLGLEMTEGKGIYLFDIAGPLQGGVIAEGLYVLPVALQALAENDAKSAWGLTADGIIYQLDFTGVPISSESTLANALKKAATLESRHFTLAKLVEQAKSAYRSITDMKSPGRYLYLKEGVFSGFAYDGKQFWVFRQPVSKQSAGILLLYSQEGILLNSFSSQPEATLSSINYSHNMLMVLDLEHRLYHQYLIADAMQPAAVFTPHPGCHPGYLPAGTSDSGGIHNLCLLYAGGQGKESVHRYDREKLIPLAAYIAEDGTAKDYFMDGFLMLAQYSPLLNGRSFGVDLNGPPSRKEDWLALFDEYYHPEANLTALEESLRELRIQLPDRKPRAARVVLGIPTPDPRCRDWDGKGYSLVHDSHRIDVQGWAMGEIIERWQKARYRHLMLAGFYFMTEQGSFNDPVLHAFPRQCRSRGMQSFAIPGLYSAWMTEFTRADFDCIAFQSSHAFTKPAGRPSYYLLKNAGHIAREFDMGMEVELPYDVMEDSGRQKLQDYLDMAHIQGWAGAFKAYFQSYDLIKSLAECKESSSRALYDSLYALSRLSYEAAAHPSPGFVPVDARAAWDAQTGYDRIKINLEGHKGIFSVSRIHAG